MKPFPSWKHPAGGVTTLLLAVAAVSVVALVWMGVRLVQQDRALEARQLDERREAAADRIVIALEQSLALEEQRLAAAPSSGFSPAAEDALLITITAGSEDIRVSPENALLYFPVIPRGQETPPGLYAAAETAEFRDHNYERAIGLLSALSQAEHPATKAGARLRLARNLRKAGRREAALEVYDLMAKPSSQSVWISGAPADLVARRARCALLEELDRLEQLQEEASRLDDGLNSGRWRLDRETYLYYRGQVARWVPPQADSDLCRRALAEAVRWLWRTRQSTGDSEPDASGRKSLRLDGTPIAVLWRESGGRLAAVVAGPGYQKSLWFDPLFRGADLSRVRVSLLDSAGASAYGDQAHSSPKTMRAASATGLPWDVVVVNADLGADLSQFAQRRRLMLAGLAILALLMIASSYLIARAVRRELAAAQLQSDFVSAVSHEFRTPLTSMRQFTEMLVENDDLPAEKRRAFYRAQERATRRLSRLVESLLDFGRMEAGARPYRLEPLDAAQLIKSVVEEFRRETSSDGFVIECAAPKEDAEVRGDREALGQALWNLLDNAVKYSGDSREVRVEVESGNHVAIHVRDWGFGIPTSEQGQILRKFARGAGAKAHGIKGTGIGLAMVKHIVDAHGGQVLIDSGPGKGSTFTIQLPAGG